MKKIKIINGTYGYHPQGSKSIEPKTADDPPFEVTDEKAKKLVSRKIAEYVDDLDALFADDEEEDELPGIAGERFIVTGSDTGSGAANEDDEDSEDSEDSEDGEDGEVPEYSVDTHVNTLRALGRAVGLTFKVGTEKTDMVAALDEYYGVNRDDAEEANDGEAPPVLSAEDPQS